MNVRDWWSLEKRTLRHPDTLLCFLAPLIVAAIAGILAFIFAPSIEDPDTAAQFSPFFSTAAQVIVTLLVALVLERRSLRAVNAQRKILRWSFSYIAIGVVAAVTALNTRLGPTAYRFLFALTVAAGIGALLSTLTIAYRAFVAEIDGRLEQGE